MKLSDAIRLGSMMKPQAHGRLLHEGATCALGAALDAVGQLNTALGSVMPYEVAANLWPILRDNYSTLEIDIVLKNDLIKLTREQIADYVAEAESKQAAPIAEPVNA